MQVILDRILAQERKLQFSIVEEGIPLTGRPAAKKPGKSSAKAKAKKAKPAVQPAISQNEASARLVRDALPLFLPSAAQVVYFSSQKDAKK